jgi:hypothetical protein
MRLIITELQRHSYGDEKMNRDEAARIFISQLVSVAYDEVTNGTKKDLREYRGPVKDWQELNRWFLQLDENHQEQVYKLIKWVAQSSVFQICAFLDGVLNLPSPVPDQVSDFALYLQTYPDWDSLLTGHPVTDSIRVNLIKESDETGDLHDMFYEMIGYIYDPSNA